MEELSRCLNLPPSPKQLTLFDAISLDCFMTNSKLSSRSDLPRYMLRRIMLLDTSCRKLPSIRQEEAPGNFNSKSLSFLDEEEDDDLVHPMDIFLYLFSISTPIFRQTIVNQLAKCQLSLPLITHDSDLIETTLNHFSFETAILNRYVGETDAKCFSALKEPLPIVSFIRIGGSDKSQKSELLNIILNIRHDYFSYRNSPGSTRKRLLLDGTVEIAWYLPKYKENMKINHHFIMLNLRGDSNLFDKQSTFIGQISTLVYVFVSLSKLTQEISNQLENIHRTFKSKVIFVVYKESRKKLENIPNLLENNNNILPIRKNNPSDDSDEIAASISHHLDKTNILPISLSQCVDIASKIGIVCDFDKNDFALKQQCIETICKDFPKSIPDGENPPPLANMKDKLLPLQRYFKSWADSNRELQLPISDRTRNMDEYFHSAKEKQDKARSSQIQELLKPSNFLCGIMDECDKHFRDTHEIDLFFVLLKDNLNSISRKFLPILYNQYKRWITESYSVNSESIGAERDAKQNKAKSCLMNAAEAITHSSLGIEHVFREFGQIYEAVIASNDAKLKASVKGKLKFPPTYLPEIAVHLILHGHSFEIVNGDDNHVPLTWVSDVLTKLSEIVGPDKKLFVVSVLGIQSSGKSTLLNTMFGINFPVSSGRCTRGLFLQMIPITKELRSKVGYDFLLLLDTEGLRAPELSGGLSYKRDNEMATFTVGLADLALINIKGESHSEVQDILQITIIAFMRMKLTLRKPKCIFVHQNVGDIQAGTNLMIARRNLIDTLDEMTKCAAQQENKELQFSHFCDLIEFDPEQDVFYFPSLFEGDPPMTSIAPGYIEKAQELKTKIIANYATKDKIFQSVKEWRKKLSNLWNSVLKENFVFSYRNILEINARIELDSAMCCWHSNFIQAMAAVKSEFINKLYNVESEFLQDTLQDINTHLIRIVQEYSQFEELNDYFFVQHEKKVIFEQWKFSTELYFECCKKKEIERIRKDCETICNVERQKQDIDNKFSICRKELFIEVRRLFDIHNDKTYFDETGIVNSLFDTFWKRWKSSFHYVPVESTDISNDLRQVLVEYSRLKQLDVFKMKQPLILDKNKFKLIGMDEFDEIYNILSILHAEEHCYYTIIDYQQSTMRKLVNYFHLSKAQNSNSNQQELHCLLNDQTKLIDDIIKNSQKMLITRLSILNT
ncbi:Interferon-induced very large GTPase 1-like [Oopsacas minuta]|uniref:Interferon-induced very large GTPase 1-like n=1 Tax=Oopsacas minuta TaxID=111878 RepID=A0AAV7JNZ5_9METZ|nr:Interferon-induced very large GTPase 1-like [Oopsacas minuta]